jgi:conjugative transfer region protein TrbK
LTQIQKAVVLIALGAICTLPGCEPQAAKSAAASPAAPTETEQERCRKLGLKVYQDDACQAERKAEQDRFLGKGGGS